MKIYAIYQVLRWQKIWFISCPVAKIVYSRGGFYERYLLEMQRLNKPAPAEATDATGHDIMPNDWSRGYTNKDRLRGLW